MLFLLVIFNHNFLNIYIYIYFYYIFLTKPSFFSVENEFYSNSNKKNREYKHTPKRKKIWWLEFKFETPQNIFTIKSLGCNNEHNKKYYYMILRCAYFHNFF
jgi:hypothetical protein